MGVDKPEGDEEDKIIELKAPNGKFRLIQWDHIPLGEERYFFTQDFDSLEAALRASRNTNVSPVTITHIFNDKGENVKDLFH